MKREFNIKTYDFELLKQLYVYRSYSGKEALIRSFIVNVLDNMNINYKIIEGNIVGFNTENKPMLSAHMDMISSVDKNPAIDHFMLYSGKEIRGFNKQDKQVILGADDKNGIFAVLQLLKEDPTLNFVFTHGEESGCIGSSTLCAKGEYKTFITEHVPYCVVIDRRNAGDIIGHSNSYCAALDYQLEKLSTKLGYSYKCTSGSVSDANTFSQYTECVNISCGYYQAHTDNEYTKLDELYDTIDFLKEALKTLNYTSVPSTRYKKTYTTYSSYNSSSLYDDGWWRSSKNTSKSNNYSWKKDTTLPKTNDPIAYEEEINKSIEDNTEPDLDVISCPWCETPLEIDYNKPRHLHEKLITCPACMQDIFEYDFDYA